MLLERLQSKDRKTLAILSDYLADIITEASEKNPEALSLSLQNVLASAVKKEIASNKDAMIDSLYPIMGGMISKYVTSAIRELMETINDKINEGLSLERFKRKIKSKVTGVSETELLLEESSEALISSLFVIHKKSSLLISEAHLRESEIDDPHMIASMASAIKDFINDWIRSSKAQDEIQLLSYGNATLYIESAGSVYLIAFMDAEPDQEQRMEINRFFASLVKKYMLFFQNFDGDDSSEEVRSLSGELQRYLDKQEALSGRIGKTSHSNIAQYLAIALLIGLSIPLAYWLKDRYTEYRIESDIADKTGYPIDIKIKDQSIVAEGSVDSFSILNSVEEIIQKNGPKKIVNRITIPMTQVERLYQEQRSRIDSNISRLSNHISTMQSELLQAKGSIHQLENRLKESGAFVDALSKELEKQTLLNQKKRQELVQKEKKLEVITKRNREIKKITGLKKSIDEKLKAAFSGNPYFNPDNDALVFSDNLFFPKGKTDMSKNSKKIIAQMTEKYLAVILSIPGTKKYLKQIIISGHTDSDGTLEYNTRLSAERASSVKDIVSSLKSLQTNGMLPLLKSKGYADRYKIMVNGVEDKNASRRIEIHYKLDEKQITAETEKLMEKSKE